MFDAAHVRVQIVSHMDADGRAANTLTLTTHTSAAAQHSPQHMHPRKLGVQRTARPDVAARTLQRFKTTIAMALWMGTMTQHGVRSAFRTLLHPDLKMVTAMPQSLPASQNRRKGRNLNARGAGKMSCKDCWTLCGLSWLTRTTKSLLICVL